MEEELEAEAEEAALEAEADEAALEAEAEVAALIAGPGAFTPGPPPTSPVSRPVKISSDRALRAVRVIRVACPAVRAVRVAGCGSPAQASRAGQRMGGDVIRATAAGGGT